jgi:UDP-N-acetylglucosamine 4,6-dehydratase
VSVFSGMNVLITGGTGTFGRAMAERLQTTDVKKIIILSRDELKQSEMVLTHADERMRFFLGDVRDKDRLLRAFDGVDIVIHAAALKQIQAATYNPAEAVKTNVLGTMNVIDAAIDCGVRKVMAISSDKACEATTLYGKTKAVLEGLVCGAGVYAPGTLFACCRYGNVFGSRGSVAPTWKSLIAAGAQALPLTHCAATRFHMHIADAVSFVSAAIAHMQGGEIFLPKLPSYRVLDLIAAFGSVPRLTGLRPYEKIHEVMIGREEARSAKDFGTHYVLNQASGGDSDVQEYSSGSNDRFLSVDELRSDIACLA